MTNDNNEINYEHAYYEMRNMAAVIINVIATEIDDKNIVVDPDSVCARSQQEQDKRMGQLLRISYRLIEHPIPTTLNSHDVTLRVLVSCLKALASVHAENHISFGGYHPSRFQCEHNIHIEDCTICCDAIYQQDAIRYYQDTK